ncbi:MAG: hypothetical protein ACLPPF_13205 [Rhodomicrobium sp.]
MTSPSPRPGFSQAGRFAYGFAQGLFRLFAAGAVIYELHQLILGFYQYEWMHIQINGGDRACAAVNWYANPGFGGTTVCRSAKLWFPWLELYEDHALPIAAFYAAVLAFLAGVALLWNRKLKAMLGLRRKDMETQQAHGAARPATATETVASGTSFPQ